MYTFVLHNFRPSTLQISDYNIFLSSYTCAFIYSRRFLRLFSSGGNQGQILWLPGEPVTMVGRGRFVAVIYHISEPLRDGTQQLGYMLLDGARANVIAQGKVSSISSASLLLWAGFSNDGSLTTMDGGGMLSMLVSSSFSSSMPSKSGILNWEWMPMLDTIGLKKSSDDTFWPITVFDGKLVCAHLKGGTKFPDATRRPVTTTLAFRIPLAGVGKG
jgi:chromosome transmission fidelity protein 4